MVNSIKDVIPTQAFMMQDFVVVPFIYFSLKSCRIVDWFLKKNKMPKRMFTTMSYKIQMIMLNMKSDQVSFPIA